jgi:xylulokinase
MYYLLGIDAGTTSMKGMLINEEGKKICLVNENYDLITPSNFFVEFEVENYWKTFKKVVKSVVYVSRVNPCRISAIAISSQGETLICLDKNGEPLRKAIVWLDNRSIYEAEEIKNEFDIKEIYKVTGQPEVTATWPATKILWLKKNEKHIFEETDKYLLVEDYLSYKLTGKYCTDKSLSSSTLYFDINRGQWWKEMIDFIDIKDDQLPDIKDSGEKIGNITGQASIETGLSKETIVVAGALDQMAGSIGAGNIYSKIVSETTGTCLAMCVTAKNPIPYSEEYKIPCHCSALSKEYNLVFWSQTAGVILEWFKNNIYHGNDEHEHSKYSKYSDAEIYRNIDYEAATIDAGADGLIILPYFSGSAVPHFNPFAKGVLFGVTLNHTRAHIARSIMEAIGFMLKEHIETAEKIGIDITEIRSLGGGAKSSLWNQIKADITGKEIVTLENTETSALGAAILAGVAAGVFENFQDACNKCVKLKYRYYPDISKSSVYESAYKKYKEIYSSISHLYQKAI